MTAPTALWRPGVDAPLFPAELLNGPTGVGNIDPELREQVGTYLAEVVSARGPVHVNVAWNALHYGWDLGAGGYTETLLKVDRLPTIAVGEWGAIPTGAIATLPSDTPVWVEVVHVEADDLTSDPDGDLLAERSGAPYDGEIRMRTVLDSSIFGPTEPEQRRVFDRLLLRGDLDAFGHLVGRKAPPDTDRARETAGDPILAYARWLASDPNRLGGGPVPVALETTVPEATTRAVAASLFALLALAGADPRLSVAGWHLSLPGRQGTLASTDLDDVVRRMRRVRGTQRRYTGAGAALRHLGTDRPLRQVRYVTALTELTAALINAASGPGNNPAGIRLRLDDAGRCGGVWRTVSAAEDPGDGYDPLVPLGLGHAAGLVPLDPPVPAAPPEPPSATDADPGSEPRGEAAPDGDSTDPSGPVGSDEQTAEQNGKRGDGLLGDLDVTASHLTFTFALRTRHLTDGTMPVPSVLHDLLSSTAATPLAVRLGHDRTKLDDDETFHEPVRVGTKPHQLRGLTWPLQFHPGLLLTGTWTIGGRILDVTSERLPDPVVFSGITLTHATDLTILAAHLGLVAPDAATERSAAGDHATPATEQTALDGDAPGASGDGDEPAEEFCGTGGPVTELEHGERDMADPRNRTYLALLLRAVARTIEPGPDGVRRFTAPVVVATAFAGLPVPRDAVGRAHRMLDAHAARGRLLRLPGERRFRSPTTGWRDAPPTYLWWPPGAAPPTHRQQSGPVVRRPHSVPVSLRRLPAGWEPSPEKVAAWPQVHAAIGPTYLPRELPPGHTWVEAHERGNDPGWRSGAVRRQ